MPRRHVRTQPATEVPRADDAGAAGGPFVDATAATRQPFAGIPMQPAHDSDNLVALVAGMPAGSRLGLERVRPDYAKGWCDTIELPHNASIDYVLSVIRESWGGGTYRLKPLTERGQWAAGAVTVNVAGEPLFKGCRYNRDGTIDDGTRPPQSQAWGYAPQQAARAAPVAAPVPDNPQIVTALSGLVQSLAGNQTAEVRAKLDEVTAALRTAPQIAPPPPVDGFGEVRKSLELLRSLKELAGDLFDGGGDDAPAPAAPAMDPQMMQMMQMMQGGAPGGAPGGMPFGGMPFPMMGMPKKTEDLMLMLAMGWMQQKNQQQQPQGGQWAAGPNGTAIYVVPVQTPQGVQWMPAQQQPAQQQQPQQQWTQPPAQQWQPPQQPQQAPPQPQWHAPPPQPAPPRAAPVVDVEAHTQREPEEPEQLTPRDVLEQLARMDPEQAARFFDEVGSNLPPHVQGALVAMMQRMQQQQQPQQQPAQRPSNVVGMSPFALSYEHDK